MTELFIALGAGLISFLSPCVLPIVPGYLCFMAGTSLDKLDLNAREIKRNVFYYSLCFVIGSSTVFIILGASATLISGLMFEYLDYLRIAGGIIIIIFGLSHLGMIKFRLSSRLSIISYVRLLKSIIKLAT